MISKVYVGIILLAWCPKSTSIVNLDSMGDRASSDGWFMALIVLGSAAVPQKERRLQLSGTDRN
jgi:hypothetical protein